MNGYEPFELGGVWMWCPLDELPIEAASLPRPVFDRLTGGELSADGFLRSYRERSHAIRALRQAMCTKAGNTRDD